MKFDELPEDARAFMDRLLETYLDQIGHPPEMSRTAAKRGMIWLFEHGEAKIVAHGEPGDPGCEYSIQINQPTTN